MLELLFGSVMEGLPLWNMDLVNVSEMMPVMIGVIGMCLAMGIIGNRH